MAIYDTAYIGTSTNRVTFNDFASSPVYRVRSRSPQRRNLRELDIPIPFESGISDFRTYIGEMAYVIEGTLYPADEAESDTGREALRKLASLDVAQADANSDDGYVPYVWTEASSTQKQLNVKVLYVDISENTSQGLVQDFRLICKIKDPTIFGATLKTLDTQSVDPTTSGGDAEYSFTYPVVYGASTFTVADTVTNNGDIATYPTSIIVNGPVTDPKITNTTTGEFIEFSTTLATSSNQLVIVYDKDTLTAEVDGTSVLSSLSDSSTLFKLPTGSSSIQLSGSAVGSGAYIQVTYRDAYPLS